MFLSALRATRKLTTRTYPIRGVALGRPREASHAAPERAMDKRRTIFAKPTASQDVLAQPRGEAAAWAR